MGTGTDVKVDELLKEMPCGSARARKKAAQPVGAHLWLPLGEQGRPDEDTLSWWWPEGTETGTRERGQNGKKVRGTREWKRVAIAYGGCSGKFFLTEEDLLP